MSATVDPTPAETVVSLLALQIENGAVVATGVASPLAILAIAVARATHAPDLTYLACVGSLDPDISTLLPSSEDLGYLEGRSAEITIPDLFDHARRGRVDTVFFGAAEVDAIGRTNMTASGSLERPRTKFPGVAGAATLRQWVHRPVLLVPRQSRRNLVPEVQVATTQDPRRTVRLISDLGVFELGASGARLTARHPWATAEDIAERTGFEFTVDEALPVTSLPDARTVAAIRALDPRGFREQLVGR
ncbi:glutaconate CoA-transferase [Myxococcus sp. CA051A]|uniref:Glutaconate CoA-transferase n=1 Tax=Myxococcus llanfairpwllgwyngyllgogerychwyrndrobwllllantysiliogogogochensis TaxID=2590453 RepID=A0A540WQE9_9BACT|nr:MULTISPECIES: CoA-transferase [Myxococcus]NTX14445.1 glutaconate CoA-transferase [Myxococcus sp. CA056]NTX64194.1 glutaconate CoA-transferase [Myxococcus sp. CA051A]TQF11226.1 glutaconate CoA-transferase [Myxococcus llanfairpwllgwyngyllgogerychwyrndrobwllllantysiliogogogochensis]